MPRTISLAAALGLATLAACGGSNKAIVPVDSPLNPWQPPEDQASTGADGSAEKPAASDGKPAEQPKAK